jgi:hypothetical protein
MEARLIRRDSPAGHRGALEVEAKNLDIGAKRLDIGAKALDVDESRRDLQFWAFRDLTTPAGASSDGLVRMAGPFFAISRVFGGIPRVLRRMPRVSSLSLRLTMKGPRRPGSPRIGTFTAVVWTTP